MAGSRFKGGLNGGELLGGDSLTGMRSSSEIRGLLEEVPQGDVRGVYARNPATTPKYHTGNTDVTREYMARLFIPFASQKTQTKYLEAVPPRARALANHLVVSDDSLGNPYNTGYIDFLLQSVNEQYNEKVQIVDAVGDNYVAYYLGQSPPVFQYGGTLLNSYQDDWRAAFTVLYNDLLRGTMLARRKAVVVLAYDDVMITGTLSNMSQMLTADFELMARFNFSMLVKRYDFSSWSPRTQFKPTPVAGYPYTMFPGEFVSVPIAGATKSIWAADTSVCTTNKQRKKTQAEPAVLPSINIENSYDPKEAYEADTIYNPSAGQVSVVQQSEAGQVDSDQLNDDFFSGHSTPL